MTLASTEKPASRIDWVRVQRNAYLAIAIAFSFAAGGWVARISDKSAQLPYLERTAAHHEAEQRVLGSNPVATVKCERHKAAVAEKVATQAVESVFLDTVPVPNLATIPNCPSPTAPK